MLGNYGPGELMDSWVETNVPMKRASQGADVAGLVAFLASEDAAISPARQSMSMAG